LIKRGRSQQNTCRHKDRTNACINKDEDKQMQAQLLSCDKHLQIQRQGQTHACTKRGTNICRYKDSDKHMKVLRQRQKAAEKTEPTKKLRQTIISCEWCNKDALLEKKKQ
jgi:hypothetical protein